MIVPAITLAFWRPVLAIEPEPGAPAPGTAERAAGAPRPELETIIVTAQKRSENQQDVSIAVAAFSDDALAAAGVSNAMQLQTVVPSLVYVATGYAAQPYLRGIGTRQSAVGLEPSIATYIDDRYVPRPFAAMFDVLDLERVEVLKGPQGTLYGRNAAGGAIRAITKDPGREPSVEIAGQAGDYGAARLRVTAGGPLSGALRGQITAAGEVRDGLATNLVPGGRAKADDIDREAYRAKLLWDITDGVAAKLTVERWEYTDWTGRDFTAVGVPEANRGGALYGGVTSRDREHFATAIDGDNDLSETAVDLRFDVAIGALDFVSATTYTHDDFVQTLDVDASSTALLDLHATEPSKTWSEELQLLSNAGGDLAWIVGAYYYRQTASNVYVFPDAVSAQPQSALGTDVSNGLQHVDSEAYALFAQATYALAERWTIVLGGRWSREEKDATLAAVPDAVTNAPTPYADARSWNEFTPRVSLEYRAEFGLAYLSYSQGFKSGGYNYPASLNPVLGPETLDSYEIGLKSDLLEKRLRVNSALFFYDFKDLQVTRGGAGAFLTTENAADANVRGLEIEADFAVTQDLVLTAAVAWVDSQYSDYTAGVLVPLTVPPYGSVPLPGGFDARGRSLLRSPKEAAHVGVRYEWTLAEGGRLPLSIDYAYKGDYYFDFSAVPETDWLKQDAYGVLNARIAYAASGDKWEVGLWGTNLTDEDYYEDAVVISVSSRVSYADPRMYGIDFKLRL
jgi:iron complex outermembrane receptor protein